MSIYYSSIFSLVSQYNIFPLLYIILFICTNICHAKVPSVTNETFILIDVSGSMKKNDPQNLRRPALRLLSSLLPSESKAAIWTFGAKSKPLLKMSTTNKNWKNKAQRIENKITSQELFTDIGNILQKALTYWKQHPIKDDQVSHRNIILLTDGMVDISKDPNKNRIEKTRILEQLVPQLQQQHIKVHTIALSENADHQFLQDLSLTTDGGFEQTDNADQLQHIFLHMFEKATPRDTVPLTDNTFTIDNSIYELTLLVFRKKNARPTEIIMPDKKKITFNKHYKKYVSWQHEVGYDLITITKPMSGEWHINAEMDPDNRAMVVTNLQMQTSPLPNNVFYGETLSILISLTENDKHIDDEDFLQVISVAIAQTQPDEEEQKWFLSDFGLQGDKKSGDGYYTLILEKTLIPGDHILNVKISSPTFQRELQHYLHVSNTLLVSPHIELLSPAPQLVYRILVSPLLEFVDPDKTQVTAFLVNSVGKKTLLKSEPSPAKLWSFPTPILDANKKYRVQLLVSTQSKQGRSIQYRSPLIELKLATKKQKKPAKKQLEVPSTAKEPPPTKNTSPVDTPVNWLLVAFIVFLSNIIIAIPSWLLYKHWKKKQKEQIQTLIEAI